MGLLHHIRTFPYILIIMTVGMFCMVVAIRYLLTNIGPLALLWAHTRSDVGKLVMLFAQYAVITSFYELREHVVENCRYNYRTMLKKYVRFSIIFSNIIWLAGMYSCLSLLWTLPRRYTDIYVIIELLILSLWIWEWCGIAVPMSAKRFWKGLISTKIFDAESYKLK